MSKQLWVLFASSLVLSATGYGLLALLPVYALELGATPAAVGTSLACAYLALLVGTVVTGWLAERMRSRKRLFVAVGVPAVPALVLLGRVESVWQLTLLTSLAWFAAGVILALINVLAGLAADPAHRGKTFGLLYLSFPLGAIAGAAATGALADRFGFPTMFALVGLTWLTPPLLGALGLRDAGADAAPTAEDCPAGVGDSPRPAIALLLAATLLASMASFVGRLGTSFSMQALQFTPGAIGSAVMVGGLLALPDLPAFGPLSDRLGRRGVLIASNLLAGGGLLLLVGATGLWRFWLASGLLFVAAHANGAVATALATDLLPARALARGLPWFGAMTWVAAVVGLAGTGYLLERLGATSLYLLAAALAVIAAALIGLLHYERCAPSPVQARLEGRRPEAGRLGA